MSSGACTKKDCHGAEFPDGKRPVVIDTGAFTSKAGICGEAEPACIHPSRDAKISVDSSLAEWRSLYERMNLKPTEQPLLLTKSVQQSDEYDKQILKNVFEKLEVPKCYLAHSATMSSYAAGRKTSLVVESGHSTTLIVPILDGYAKLDAVVNVPSCGSTLSEAVAKGLNVDLETAHRLKEKSCYVAIDFDAEVAKVPEDNKIAGQEYNLGQLGFRLPEALVAPSNVGCKGPGLTGAIVAAANKCDADRRAELYENIILTGGNTLLKGLSERLSKDLESTTPAGLTPKIVSISADVRLTATWIGGSILSTLPDFQTSWVTKDMYNKGETGN